MAEGAHYAEKRTGLPYVDCSGAVTWQADRGRWRGNWSSPILNGWPQLHHRSFRGAAVRKMAHAHLQGHLVAPALLSSIGAWWTCSLLIDESPTEDEQLTFVQTLTKEIAPALQMSNGAFDFRFAPAPRFWRVRFEFWTDDVGQGAPALPNFRVLASILPCGAGPDVYPPGGFE